MSKIFSIGTKNPKQTLKFTNTVRLKCYPLAQKFMNSFGTQKYCRYGVKHYQSINQSILSHHCYRHNVSELCLGGERENYSNMLADNAQTRTT